MKRHIAPVVHLAVRSNQLLRAERKAHKATRHLLAIANARAKNAEALAQSANLEFIDADVRCQRLEVQLKFITQDVIEGMEADLG